MKKILTNYWFIEESRFSKFDLIFDKKNNVLIIIRKIQFRPNFHFHITKMTSNSKYITLHNSYYLLSIFQLNTSWFFIITRMTLNYPQNFHLPSFHSHFSHAKKFLFLSLTFLYKYIQCFSFFVDIYVENWNPRRDYR